MQKYHFSKVRTFLLAGLAVLSLSACQAEITDPEEDENHDDESSEDSNNTLGPIGDATPTGTPTGAPLACVFPQGPGAATKVCLKQTAANVDEYVPHPCDNNLDNHSWVKAIGGSKTPPKEVWVAIPNDDDNFETKTISGFGGTETTYSPSLTHNDGVITGHKQCDLTVEFLNVGRCPADPTGQSCINTGIANDTSGQTSE